MDHKFKNNVDDLMNTNIETSKEIIEAPVS
jgi:hypothetical protein